MAKRDKTMSIESTDQLFQPATRREFLRLLGIGGGLMLMPSVFAACSDDDPVSPTTPTAVSLNLSNDTGILNYAYALEQLEAAFYTAALASPGYAALTANEKEVIDDLQKHEVIHREFFKTVLGTNAIGTLQFNAATVASLMSSKDALLRNSQLLEDTGVSAYNGAGKYLSDKANLLVAGKIVSVEARHAAAIRDMRDATGRLFAGDDVVNASGLDVKAEPGTVLSAVASLNVIDTSKNTIAIGTQPTRTPATSPEMPAPTPA
jgi:hypothetical protein